MTDLRKAARGRDHMNWRSGRPYDEIRADRDSYIKAEISRLVDLGALECDGYQGYFVMRNGQVFSTLGRRLTNLRPGTKPGGYKFVGLSTSNGMKYEMVHRLVAKAFLPNVQGLPEVNHIDGDKSNNNVSNLEWCDRTHNARHAHLVGLMPHGPASKSKLTADDIQAIRCASGRYEDIGRDYGVSKQTVCNIKRGYTKSWKRS